MWVDDNLEVRARARKMGRRGMGIGFHPAAAAAAASITTRCLRSSASSSGTGDEGGRLVQWVQQGGGAVWPGLRVERDGDGLGLVAARPAQAGHKLISLPSQLLLSLPPAASDAAADRALRRLTDRVPEELWTLKLGLKLLAERAKVESFWWPYISILPQRFSVPIFFSGEDIASLQYPPLIHQVNKRCKFLLQFVKHDIPSALGNLDDASHPFCNQEVDAGSLGWAMAAVSSRAFRVQTSKQLDDGSGSRKLLPLVDMCNHSFQANARLEQQNLDDGEGGDFALQVVAEEDLVEGAPIVLNYGPLSNDLLLLDYGFVLPNNPHDTVDLRFDVVLSMLDEARAAAGVKQPSKLASFASPAPWQQAIFVQLRLQGAGAALMTTLGRSQVDSRLLAAIRVLFADDAASLRNKSLDALQDWGPDAPLGIVNESNVLQTLVALCAMLLSRFPTTAVEDQDLLRSSSKEEAASPTRNLAISYRLHKKQLLLDLINSCWSRLASLEREKRAATPLRSEKKGKGFG